MPLPGAHGHRHPIRAGIGAFKGDGRDGRLLGGVLRGLTHHSRLTNRYAGRRLPPAYRVSDLAQPAHSLPSRLSQPLLPVFGQARRPTLPNERNARAS
jgi:hypothetical protein